MTGPVVLLMVAAMALVVLFCAGRLVLAPGRQRPTDRGTDLLHVTMGTAMVAMLVAGSSSYAVGAVGMTGMSACRVVMCLTMGLALLTLL
jgi:hypothetical protein